MTSYYDCMFKIFSEGLAEWYHWNNLQNCTPLKKCEKDLITLYSKLEFKDEKRDLEKYLETINEINANHRIIEKVLKKRIDYFVANKNILVFADESDNLYVNNKYKGWIKVNTHKRYEIHPYQYFTAFQENWDIDVTYSPKHLILGYNQFAFPKFNLIAFISKNNDFGNLSFGIDIQNVNQITFVGYDFQIHKFLHHIPITANMMKVLIHKRSNIVWNNK